MKADATKLKVEIAYLLLILVATTTTLVLMIVQSDMSSTTSVKQYTPKFSTETYNNHSYIKYQSVDGTISITHSPDCFKCKYD